MLDLHNYTYFVPLPIPPLRLGRHLLPIAVGFSLEVARYEHEAVAKRKKAKSVGASAPGP